VRDDVSLPAATWLAPLPGTDVAVMLGIAYVLATERLADRSFLSSHCSGYEVFERYLLGASGGQPRTPEWAQSVSSVPAHEIRRIAHRLVDRRSLINVSWSGAVTLVRSSGSRRRPGRWVRTGPRSSWTARRRTGSNTVTVIDAACDVIHSTAVHSRVRL
jgi:predicted molibdopterin-dependent oxidoreductase YjgC